MNLLTLIGAAVVCREFCELLFKEPEEAAQLLGIVLTNFEIEQLKKTFKEEPHLCNEVRRLTTFFCKRPPCPYAIVPPGRKDFCKDYK